MIVKIIIINGLIVSAILGMVYFGQQKNSKTYAQDFYQKSVESNKYAKSADDWIKNTFYPKAQQEAQKRQEVAGESLNNAAEDAKKGIIDAIWQSTVGNLEKGVESFANAISSKKDDVIESVTNSFCPAK